MVIALILLALAPLAVLVVVLVRERVMVRRWNDLVARSDRFAEELMRAQESMRKLNDRLAETDMAVRKALETVGEMAAATVQLIEAARDEAIARIAQAAQLRRPRKQ